MLESPAFHDSADTIRWQIGGDYEAHVVKQSENARKKTILEKKPWRASEAIIRLRMGILEKIVLACDIWTSRDIFGPLDSTNYRIYSAMYVISQSLDDVP